MKKTLLVLTIASALLSSQAVVAETQTDRYPNANVADISAVHGVNWDNYVQAETDWNFRQVTNKVGVN